MKKQIYFLSLLSLILFNDLSAQNLDTRIFRSINDHHSKFSDDFYSFQSNSVKPVYIGVPLGFVATGIIRKDRQFQNVSQYRQRRPVAGLEDKLKHFFGRNASYFVWFEVGRNEIMRDLGYPYAQLESEGFFLPVIEAHCNYVRPIRYDDELDLHSEFTEQNGARLKIEYKMFCKSELVATGFTVHAFTDHNGRPARPPKKFLEKLK